MYIIIKSVPKETFNYALSQYLNVELHNILNILRKSGTIYLRI